MNFKKEQLRYSANGQTKFELYSALTEKYAWNCLDAGAPGASEFLHGEKIKHFVIGCEKLGISKAIPPKEYMHEPTYNEKLEILHSIGLWKEVALEVFPPECEVVDVEEVYHIWEFQYPYSFVLNIIPAKELHELNGEYANVKYGIYIIDGVEYLYLQARDGHELRWSEKQKLKNKLIGEERTAVEIIWSEIDGANYTCLICLMQNDYLDFGLVQPAW